MLSLAETITNTKKLSRNIYEKVLNENFNGISIMCYLGKHFSHLVSHCITHIVRDIRLINTNYKEWE